jgi:hypothetical protein
VPQTVPRYAVFGAIAGNSTGVGEFVALAEKTKYSYSSCPEYLAFRGFLIMALAEESDARILPRFERHRRRRHGSLKMCELPSRIAMAENVAAVGPTSDHSNKE